MMIQIKLSIISALVLLTAYTSPTKKCPKAIPAAKDERALEEERAPKFTWTGSGIPLCINSTYTKYYKQRYFDLELWEKGMPDGEMCGGTALTQYKLEEMTNSTT